MPQSSARALAKIVHELERLVAHAARLLLDRVPADGTVGGAVAGGRVMWAGEREGEG